MSCKEASCKGTSCQGSSCQGTNWRSVVKALVIGVVDFKLRPLVLSQLRIGKVKVSASLEAGGQLTQPLLVMNTSTSGWSEVLVTVCADSDPIPASSFWKVIKTSSSVLNWAFPDLFGISQFPFLIHSHNGYIYNVWKNRKQQRGRDSMHHFMICSLEIAWRPVRIY